MVILKDSNGDVIESNSFTFPGGERHVTIIEKNQIFVTSYVEVYCEYKSSDDIIDIALYVDAIREITKNRPIQLTIPYFPYARQDRRANKGEAHSLKVIANIINELEFNVVKVFDPHSNVVEAIINNLFIIPQESLFKTYVNKHNIDLNNMVLVSPDAGASKKTLAIANALSIDTVIRADKIRDTKTGNIVDTVIYDATKLNQKDVWICDDICDGGRTFIELAKVIRLQSNPNSVNLFVTHGIFSKGIEALEEYFDSINYIVDLRK